MLEFHENPRKEGRYQGGREAIGQIQGTDFKGPGATRTVLLLVIPSVSPIWWQSIVFLARLSDPVQFASDAGLED